MARSDPQPAVLLDLDGTLVDSGPGILASCRAALRALGHEPAPDFDVRTIIGPPIEDGMRLLLRPYGDDRVEEAVAAYRADYGAEGLLQSTLYPGIAEALRDLRDHGARLYLATSKLTVFARRILEHLELAARLDGIYGSEPGGALDHKTELIADVLSRHGLQPDQTVMVGDRRYDIAGAHANQLRAIGVLWGYGDREELEAAGADRLIEAPDELAATALAMIADERR
jgi:phosphoglycolate phosphatase